MEGICREIEVNKKEEYLDKILEYVFGDSSNRECYLLENPLDACEVISCCCGNIMKFNHNSNIVNDAIMKICNVCGIDNFDDCCGSFRDNPVEISWALDDLCTKIINLCNSESSDSDVNELHEKYCGKWLFKFGDNNKPNVILYMDNIYLTNTYDGNKFSFDGYIIYVSTIDIAIALNKVNGCRFYMLDNDDTFENINDYLSSCKEVSFDYVKDMLHDEIDSLVVS